MPPLLTALAAALTLLADQISKRFLQDASGPLIPGLVSLRGARNTGAAFSLLSHLPWLTPLLSGLVIAGLICFLIRKRPAGLTGFALALVLGGALGNLTDRLRLGYVIDFLQLDFISFPIFNLADVAITAGCALLIARILFSKEGPHA